MQQLKKVQIILFRNSQNPEFLLLKTNRTHSIWQGITGGVEETDRSLKYAAVRELEEELGIKTTEDKIIGPLHEFEFETERPGFEGTTAKEYCFAFEIPSIYEVRLSPEHTEYKWLPYPEAIQLIDYNTPKLVVKKVMEYLKLI